MSDYTGYKVVDNIILVERAKREGDNNYPQAYLVDPANKSQLENARYWGTYTEYGPSVKQPDGHWVTEWTKKHEPIEHLFENKDFKLQLLNCAGGSSQGGKLSFWNCLVTKDDQTFKIGIDSDMLLELLKNANFNHGTCDASLVFITRKGRVGLTVEGSPTHQQCLKDVELKKTLTSKATTKYSFGDRISTATINEIYLGSINQYYVVETIKESRYSWHTQTLVRKLDKPIKHHIFIHNHNYKTGKPYESVSEILAEFEQATDRQSFGLPRPEAKKPKRAITGKLDIDISEEDFLKRLVELALDYPKFVEAEKEYAKEHRWHEVDSKNLIRNYIRTSFFGFNLEDYKLAPEIIKTLLNTDGKYEE